MNRYDKGVESTTPDYSKRSKFGATATMASAATFTKHIIYCDTQQVYNKFSSDIINEPSWCLCGTHEVTKSNKVPLIYNNGCVYAVNEKHFNIKDFKDLPKTIDLYNNKDTLKTYNCQITGLGYYLTIGGRLSFIDVDNAFIDGTKELRGPFKKIIDLAILKKSYIEYSPSGLGLRIPVLKDGANLKSNGIKLDGETTQIKGSNGKLKIPGFDYLANINEKGISGFATITFNAYSDFEGITLTETDILQIYKEFYPEKNVDTIKDYKGFNHKDILKDKISLHDVVEKYYGDASILDGNKHMCPLHTGSQPSFEVMSKNDNKYICYSSNCKAGKPLETCNGVHGDIFDFTQNFLKLSNLHETINRLADDFGIDLKQFEVDAEFEGNQCYTYKNVTYKLPRDSKIKGGNLIAIERDKKTGEIKGDITIGEMLYIVGVYIEDTGHTGLVIDINNRLQYVQYDNLMSKSKIIQSLACYGFTVNDTNARPYIQFISWFFRINTDLKKYIKISQLGWSGKDFLPYVDNAIMDKSTKKMMEGRGNFDIWKTQINEYRENIYFRFIFGLYVASPILKILNKRSIIVHTFGATRQGKSALCLACLSVWGNPFEMQLPASSTLNAMEDKAAELNHLPLYLDECKDNQKYKGHFSDIVYQLGNGKGKARCERSGKRKEEKTWNSIIFSTAEMQLIQDTDMGGVNTRLLEFGNIPAFLDEKQAGSVYKLIANNYGFGQKFIDAIKDTDFKKLDYHIDANDTKLSTHMDIIELSILGDYIANIVLNNKYDIENPKEELKTIVNDLRNKDDINMGEAIMDLIKQKVVENKDNFNETNFKSVKILGKIDKDTKEICILPSILESWMSEAGFPKSVAKNILISEYVKTREGKKLVQRRIAKTKTSVYCFDSKKLDYEFETQALSLNSKA